MVNYMKVKKIETTLPLKVQGQACTNNCEEKIWAGKKKLMVGKLAAGIQLGILLVEHGGKPCLLVNF